MLTFDRSLQFLNQLVKGSLDPSHFIFEINVGKRRNPTLNDSEFEPAIDFESIWKFIIQLLSRFMSDPSISDIDFKNKMALGWFTLETF